MVFDGYPTTAQMNYQGAASGTNRVGRSGSWNYYASGCTVAYRIGINPGNQGNNVGFRVVRP